MAAPVNFDSRALLSSEALEEHLRVAVDAEVLNGLGVLRRACRILPGSGLGERRAQGVSESLHRGSRRQSWVCGRVSLIASLVELVLSEQEAATHGGTSSAAAWPVSKLQGRRSRPRPTSPRKQLENTSFINIYIRTAQSVLPVISNGLTLLKGRNRHTTHN